MAAFLRDARQIGAENQWGEQRGLNTTRDPDARSLLQRFAVTDAQHGQAACQLDPPAQH